MRTPAAFLIFLASLAASPGASVGASLGASLGAPARPGPAIAAGTSGHAGADPGGAAAGCPAPVLPALPAAESDAGRARKAIAAWERCHAAHLARLRAGPEARIPAEVLAAMSHAERERARAHARAVQARLLQAAQADGEALAARHASWLGARTERVAPEGR